MDAVEYDRCIEALEKKLVAAEGIATMWRENKERVDNHLQLALEKKRAAEGRERKLREKLEYLDVENRRLQWLVSPPAEEG